MSTFILRSGDMRPWIAELFKHYYKNRVHIHTDTSFGFHCQQLADGTLKREPDFEGFDTIHEHMRRHPDQIHIVGVKVFSRVCKSKPGQPTIKPDHHGHWYPLVVNPVTKKVYLYNPLMFHLDSPNHFSFGEMTKGFVKALKAKFEEHGTKLESVVAPKIHKTLSRRVHKWASEKIGHDASSRMWYPLLVMAEIGLSIEHPSKQRADIMGIIRNMDDAAFDQFFTRMQDQLETYYMNKVYNKRDSKDACHKGKLLHGETNRCVVKDGKVGLKLQNMTPSKICNKDQAYHIQTQRCRKLNYTFVNVDMVSADSNEKTFLDNAVGTPQLSKYMRGKYPHAAVFDGGEITWRYEVEKQEGLMMVPRAIDEFCRRALRDPKKRQLVVFVELTSSVFETAHANVIIYTKSTRELEVFEPNGVKLSPKFGHTVMYREVESHFRKLVPDLHMRLPIDYCPKKAAFFQDRESDEHAMWKTDGYCAVWTVWYTEHRLMNPELTTKDCVDVALQHLVDMGSLREFIWNYDRWMRREMKMK